MRSGVGRLLDMAERVLYFLGENTLGEPGHQAAKALFEARLGVVKELVARSADGRLTAKAAREGRRNVRDTVEQRHLRHLVTVAEEAKKTDPDRFGLFRMPDPKVRLASFGSALRSMVTAARESEGVLKALGLGETVLADLEEAVAKFDEHSRVASVERSKHTAATKAIGNAAADLVDAIDLLDGIYRYRFGDQPELLARWKNVRDVANRRRSKPVTPPTKGGDTKTA